MCTEFKKLEGTLVMTILYQVMWMTETAKHVVKRQQSVRMLFCCPGLQEEEAEHPLR